MQELFFCEFTLTEYNQYKKDIMNKLRKAMIGAVLCALPLMASGQDIHWQARGGIGYSTAFAGVTNIKDRVGFHVGGGADIGLSKNGVWRFQPSLQFVRKGWKFDGFYGNEQIMEAQYGTRLDYLQLPLQMAARLRLGKDCFLTFRSGGYVAYGLSGKTHMNVLNTDHSETFGVNHFSRPFDFNSCAYDKENRKVGYPSFNRWDAGAYGGMDLTVGHIIIGYNVAVGLTKVCNAGFMGNPVGNAATAVLLGAHPKNISADLSIGYQF